MMDKIQRKIIQDVADKHNITFEQAYDVYESQFALMREVISNIDFNVVESEEDFNALKKNFTLPRLMKFYAEYKLLKKHKRIKK